MAACKKDAPPSYVDAAIQGYWSNPTYTDTTVTYTRSTSLPQNAYGFLITNNNKFVEHKNIGSCGTPPVVYGIYEGSWTSIGDTLKITVGFWGGITTYKWLIVNIDENELVIHEIYAY